MTKTAALITGASSGIGKEFARLAAADGYNVVLTARNKQALRELKTELDHDYPDQDIAILPADLGKAGMAGKLYATIRKKYDIAMLINNAGFGDYAPVSEADGEKLDDMIRLNVSALTELTRLAAADMSRSRNQDGYILNVASVAAFFPGPLMATYYATKAYVLSFTEAIAEELKDSNIFVTALCPGPTRTNFDLGADMEGEGMFKNPSSLPSATAVARFGYASLLTGKTVAVHGRKNKLTIFLARLLPRSLVRKLVMKQQA